MKHLNRSQGIAVFAGLGVMTYLFFSGPLADLFSPNREKPNNQMMESGIKVRDIVIGTGEVVVAGDRLTVHYVGTLTDGRVFDSSRDRNTPIQFTLGIGQVIRGWDEGLVGMRVGGKRILTISPDYGYGSRAVGAIPANSILVFEVELLDVEKPQ